MAVPKRRMSRANTRTRRSQWKAHNPALMETKIDGQTVAYSASTHQGRPIGVG